LCDIPQNKAPRTGPHHIWRTVCPFSGHKNTDGSIVRFTGQCLLWQLLLRLVIIVLLLLQLVVNIASLRT